MQMNLIYIFVDTNVVSRILMYNKVCLSYDEGVVTF